MAKQYIRVYRNSLGEVRHVLEQDTPITSAQVFEHDENGQPLIATREDIVVNRDPMQRKQRARALLEIFRTAESDEEIRERIPGEVTFPVTRTPIPARRFRG